MPNRQTGISLMEMLTSNKSDHCYFQRAKIWVCPTYVLNLKLQNNQKIPKWNCCFLLGQFVELSNEHCLLVANMWNLQNGYVSPQYHCVFDNILRLYLVKNMTLTHLIRFVMRYFKIAVICMLKNGMTMESNSILLLHCMKYV